MRPHSDWGMGVSRTRASGTNRGGTHNASRDGALYEARNAGRNANQNGGPNAAYYASQSDGLYACRGAIHRASHGGGGANHRFPSRIGQPVPELKGQSA